MNEKVKSVLNSVLERFETNVESLLLKTELCLTSLDKTPPILKYWISRT